MHWPIYLAHGIRTSEILPWDINSYELPISNYPDDHVIVTSSCYLHFRANWNFCEFFGKKNAKFNREQEKESIICVRVR